MEPSNSTWLSLLTLKVLTSEQIKKNLMTYYYLNTSCDWGIKFHIEPYTYS